MTPSERRAYLQGRIDAFEAVDWWLRPLAKCLTDTDKDSSARLTMETIRLLADQKARVAYGDIRELDEATAARAEMAAQPKDEEERT